MPTIKTPDDWWEVAQANTDNMINALDEFGVDTSQHKGHLRIDENPHDIGKPLSQHIKDLAATKDDKLKRYVHEIWASAPDKKWIHSLPGWYDICDLCSEQWVFGEEQH